MLRSALVCSSALLLLSALTTPTHAEPRPMLAVLDFVSAGADVTETELSLLTDVSRAEARRTLGSAYTIITQESIQQLLKAHGKTLEQCQGECETETGKLLGAELVVSGRLVKAFGAYKANLKLHRTEPPELLDARVLTVNTLAALEGAVRQGTSQILSSLYPASAKKKVNSPKERGTQTTVVQDLERTASDMARNLAKRTQRDEARDRARSQSSKQASKNAARTSEIKPGHPDWGKPKRCHGIRWNCIKWIEEDVWFSFGFGLGMSWGDHSDEPVFSMVFDLWKVRYPYNNSHYLFTKLDAGFAIPLTSPELRPLPSAGLAQARWGGASAGCGFAIDSVTGAELGLGVAYGWLDQVWMDEGLGETEETVGDVGFVASLNVIHDLPDPFRVSLTAASFETPQDTVLMTSLTMGWEF